MRWALPAPPVVTGFYRMAIAALLMGSWLALRRHQPRLTPRSAALAILAGACFGSDLALWHTSIVRIPVGLATLLVNVTPVHVGLYASLVLGQRLERRFVAGAGLALLGTALLLGLPAAAPVDRTGPVLALGASLFYAAYLLTMAEARREIDLLSAFFLMTLAAATVLGLYGLALGNPFHGFPASSWWAMAGAALVTQLGGVMGIIWALRYLPATLASVALLGQPVGTALLGWWLLGEAIGPLQALGGLAVLAGIGLAARTARAAR